MPCTRPPSHVHRDKPASTGAAPQGHHIAVASGDALHASLRVTIRNAVSSRHPLAPHRRDIAAASGASLEALQARLDQGLAQVGLVMVGSVGWPGLVGFDCWIGVDVASLFRGSAVDVMRYVLHAGPSISGVNTPPTLLSLTQVAAVVDSARVSHEDREASLRQQINAALQKIRAYARDMEVR